MGHVHLPKAIIQIKIGYSQEMLYQIENKLFASLHSRLVRSVLEEPADPMLLCGLSYSLSAFNDGLAISFDGFDEHIEELVELVLPRIFEPEHTKDQFEVERRQMMLDLADVTSRQPYQHALEAFEIVTVRGQYARSEQSSALKNASLVNFDKLRMYLVDLQAATSVTVLFTGNINRSRALSITNIIKKSLRISDEPDFVASGGKLAVLRPKENIKIQIANPIVGDTNSVTLLYYQFGVPTLAERVHLAMLQDVISRPVFDTLRTELQLGYIVSGDVVPHQSIVEFRLLVQGTKEDPEIVEDLMELTTRNLTMKIDSLDQSEFETRKHTMRVLLQANDTRMAQTAGRYWGQIWDRTNCFTSREMQLKYINSKDFSSPKALLETWKKIVQPPSRKISVMLFGSGLGNKLSLCDSTLDTKVVAHVTSREVIEELQDEDTWPVEYICKNPLS